MTGPLKILHVGKSSRAHLLAETMLKSRHEVVNYMICEVTNPGLNLVSEPVKVGPCDDPDFVVAYAREIKPAFAIHGPEEPLAAGVVDRLLEIGVSSVGPLQELAQLEASKSFTRSLLREYGIPGNPDYRVFNSLNGLEDYLNDLGEFVIKPDGLSGGKGVKVFGDHFSTIAEGFKYCCDLLHLGGRVVVEEKLVGEEFTFQSFCDGHTVIDTIPVQDHKRLLDGDLGPNTGGMGSYSCADHLLPFLSANDIKLASEINRRVAAALLQKTGKPYKGILYGSFIVTARGLRVIEYNARFGDPEAMNVLSILEGDLVDICLGIIEGNLHEVPISFAKKATVCKYVVPQGYPENPIKGVPIILPNINNDDANLRMYYGAVELNQEGKLVLTGSRAVAFVGIGDTLCEAEAAAERGASAVTGLVFHRRDIGTEALVQRRVDRMLTIRRGYKSAHAA